MPKVYKVDRPLHDDWPWPFSKIPRRLTGYCFPMPPHKIAGNAESEWIARQDGYPLAPDAELNVNKSQVKSMHPVHAVGYWSIQSVYVFGRRIPCYISASTTLFGRRLHVNGGIKPDVTWGDWFWWFEMSVTWTKVDKL